MAEIGFAAIVVSQGAVIHHLQQQVKHLWIGFLDFIQQQNGMRVLVDLLGQQSTLIKSDITRRGTDQTRNRV